jgi:hypothetical protein
MKLNVIIYLYYCLLLISVMRGCNVKWRNGGMALGVKMA